MKNRYNKLLSHQLLGGDYLSIIAYDTSVSLYLSV